jgi:hypothetical protein
MKGDSAAGNVRYGRSFAVADRHDQIAAQFGRARQFDQTQELIDFVTDVM